MRYRPRTLLLILVALNGLNIAGCFVRFGSGGTGDSDEEEVIYYPPGPEFRNTQEDSQRTAREPSVVTGVRLPAETSSDR